MITKTQGTGRRIFRVKSSQMENTPRLKFCIFLSFSSQMKIVDQNIRTKKEEETLTNTLSSIFTKSNED